MRLCGNSICNQKGASVIAVVAAMLILGVMGVTLISLVTTGSDVSINQLQSEKAFNIADGGVQYALGFANMTSNVPNYSTNGAWKPLGDGAFKVDTPAYLTANVAIGATTINVDSTDKFPPAPGRITIDSELILYTAKVANTFTVNPVTTAHNQYNSVYPAARLAAKIPNDPACATVATITVSDNLGDDVYDGINDGFDRRHSFFIDNEYFYCTVKTANQFQNCTRCYAGSPFGLHSSTYASQYILTSTGRITNISSNTAQRVVRVSVGPK